MIMVRSCKRPVYNFSPHLTMDVITYSCCDYNEIMSVKGTPGTIEAWEWTIYIYIYIYMLSILKGISLYHRGVPGDIC